MNAQDREDIKELSRELKSFVKDWYKQKENTAGFHATMKLKVKDLSDSKTDHENRIRGLEGAERKTIVIASLVGAIVTGLGAVILSVI